METTGWAFEHVAPGENTFVAVGFDPSEVHVPSTARVVGVPNDRAGRGLLEEMIADSRIAIFHSVSEKLAGILAAAPPSVVRVWSGWGGDYYGSTYDSYANQLAPATKKVVHGAVRPTYWAGRALRALRIGPTFQAAARSADFFSAPVPEDLAVFHRRFPQFTGRYSQLNYVTVEDSIATDPKPSLGKNILLGNSASPTNNHLDVLARLSKVDLGGRKVVAPLSYGDAAYAAAVAKAGSSLLGESFVAVTDFLPLAEYNEMLAGCGIVVLGHHRQEGLGNVLRALWQGARLILDSRSPVAAHLMSRGVEVEYLDDVSSDSLELGAVSPSQLAARAAYLESHWSREAVAKNVSSLVEAAGGLR